MRLSKSTYEMWAGLECLFLFLPAVAGLATANFRASFDKVHMTIEPRIFSGLPGHPPVEVGPFVE